MNKNNKWLQRLPYDQINKLVEVYRSWENAEYYHEMIDEMYGLIRKDSYDIIITIETTGIIFAAPIAYKLNKGIVVIRKNAKSERNILKEEYLSWNGKKSTLEIDITDIQNKSYKCLYIDDIIQTKSSIITANKLLIKSGNILSGILCFANISNSDKINDIKINGIINMGGEQAGGAEK